MAEKKDNLNKEGDRQGKLLVLSGSISVGRVGGGGVTLVMFLKDSK